MMYGQDQRGADSVDAGESIVLAPTHQLTFAPPTDPQSVLFHPNEQTAWVHAHEATVDLWPLVVNCGVYPAGAVLGLLLCVLLWRAARLARRPQRRGRTYCCECNYDVTEQLVRADAEGAAPGEARCPECGTTCATQRLAAGRTLLRRLARPLMAVGAALVVFGFFLLVRGPLNAQAVLWQNWPSQIAWRAAKDHGWRWLAPYQTLGDVVRTFDLGNGAQGRVLHRDCSATAPLSTAAPDGSAIFLIGKRGIKRVDTRSGRVTPRDPDFPGLMPSLDMPLVAHVDLQSGEVFYAGMDRPAPDSVMAMWNPDTGDIREAFRFPVASLGGTFESLDDAQFVHVNSDGPAVWAMRLRTSLKLLDATGALLGSRGANTDGTCGVAAVTIAPGDRREVIYDFVPHGNVIEFYDGEDLEYLRFVAPPWGFSVTGIAASPDARFMCVSAYGSLANSSTRRLPPPAVCIWVLDTVTLDWVARLDCPGTIMIEHVTMSAGGRWVAARCTVPAPGTAGGWGKVLLIWDLQPVIDATGP